MTVGDCNNLVCFSAATARANGGWVAQSPVHDSDGEGEDEEADDADDGWSIQLMT